jgi:hypothetical protein
MRVLGLRLELPPQRAMWVWVWGAAVRPTVLAVRGYRLVLRRMRSDNHRAQPLRLRRRLWRRLRVRPLSGGV